MTMTTPKCEQKICYPKDYDYQTLQKPQTFCKIQDREVKKEAEKQFLQHAKQNYQAEKVSTNLLVSKKYTSSSSTRQDTTRNTLSISELETLVAKVLKLDKSESYDDLKAFRAAKREIRLTEEHLKTHSLETPKTNEQLRSLSDQLVAAKSELCQNEEVVNFFIKERISALREGIKVRNQNITTNELLPILRQYLIGVLPHKIKDTARVICRQINEVMEEPEKYAGQFILLHKDTQKYPFFFFGRRGKQQLTLDFTYWLKVSEKMDRVELFLMPNSEKTVGKGSNKEIFIGQYINLLFKRNIHKNPSGKIKVERPSIYKPMVILKPKEDGSLEDVESGMKFHKELAENLPESHLTSIPIKLLDFSDLKKVPKTLYFQDWYNGDLRKVSTTRKVPLDFSEKPEFINIDDNHIIEIFRDIARALIGWHRYGVIHRDIKLTNILVQVLEDGKSVSGILADYDIAQRPGNGFFNQKPYEYWDSLSNQGIVTSFTDLYGLVMSLAEVYIPKFINIKPHEVLKQRNFLILQAKINSPLKKLIVEKILDYLKLFFEYNNQLSSDFPLNKRLIDIQQEINEYFCPHNNPVHHVPYLDAIIANIPNFKCLAPLQQSTSLLSKLADLLNNKTISSTQRSILLKLYSRTVIWTNQMTMSNYLSGLPTNQRAFHPLYFAMLNPEKINPAAIQNEIFNEISLIDVSKYPLLDNWLQNLNIADIEDPLKYRQVLKERLATIFHTKDVSSELLAGANYLLHQIYLIEDTMTYLVKVGEIKNRVALDIVEKTKQSMQAKMQDFLNLLDDLQTTINL